MALKTSSQGTFDQILELLKLALYLAVYLFLLLALLRPVDAYFLRSIPLLPAIASSSIVCALELVVDMVVAVLVKTVVDKLGEVLK